MGIFQKNGIYINLAPAYQKEQGEKKLREAIDFVGQFRMKPTTQSILDEVNPESDLRRMIFQEFPMMSKL